MSEHFKYLPEAGPLPGYSFEEQTCNFLESLYERTDETREIAEGAVATAENAMTEAENATSIANAKMDTTFDNAAGVLPIAHGGTGANSAANARLSLGIEPSGLICLWYGSNIPAGWRKCDGSQGTPDLSGYVTSPLFFIQRI